MSQSDNGGVTWTTPEVATNANLVDGGVDDFLNGNIRGVSVYQARYNWVAPAVGVAFHAWQDAAETATDVYFVSKTLSGWQAKKRVNITTVNDQWMAGLDYSPSGQWLVSFFDRSADTSNILYEEAWARLRSDGVTIETDKVLNVVATDPTDNHNQRFVGDYQEVWWWEYPNDSNIEDEFILAYPQLDDQGDMHVSGVH